MVWSLADQVKNLIEKKWPGLSDSNVVSGGLKDLNLSILKESINVKTRRLNFTKLPELFNLKLYIVCHILLNYLLILI